MKKKSSLGSCDYGKNLDSQKDSRSTKIDEVQKAVKVFREAPPHIPASYYIFSLQCTHKNNKKLKRFSHEK